MTSRACYNAAVNRLAERLDVERTAMGKMVGFLERDGLVAIQPSPTDGRSRNIESYLSRKPPVQKSGASLAEAQCQFDQLNGAEKVVALRRGFCGTEGRRDNFIVASSGGQRPRSPSNLRTLGSQLPSRTHDPAKASRSSECSKQEHLEAEAKTG